MRGDSGNGVASEAMKNSFIVFANAYHQWTALPSSNERVRLAPVYQHNGVSTNNFIEGITHS